MTRKGMSCISPLFWTLPVRCDQAQHRKVAYWNGCQQLNHRSCHRGPHRWAKVLETQIILQCMADLRYKDHTKSRLIKSRADISKKCKIDKNKNWVAAHRWMNPCGFGLKRKQLNYIYSPAFNIFGVGKPTFAQRFNYEFGTPTVCNVCARNHEDSMKYE